METRVCRFTEHYVLRAKNIGLFGQLSFSTAIFMDPALLVMSMSCCKRIIPRLLPQIKSIALINTLLNLSSLSFSSLRGSKTSCKHNSDIS